MLSVGLGLRLFADFNWNFYLISYFMWKAKWEKNHFCTPTAVQ